MLNPRYPLAKKILDNPELTYWLKDYLGNSLGIFLIGYLEIGAMNIIQNLPQKNIESFQLDRLNSIINYSIKSVPFWRNLFEGREVELNMLSDVEKIPILTRDKIKTNPDSFLSSSKDAKLAYTLTTSGSTTTPMRFYIDKELFFRRAFAMRYALKFFCQNPWSNTLRLNYKDMPWSQYQGYYYDLSFAEKNLSNFYNLIKEYKYDAFYGTTSHLLWLADLIKNNPLDYQIKFAVSRSEYLSPENRKHLESVFGCKVFNIYASREFGPLAQECPFDDGFHLNEDGFLFEIVDDKGQTIKNNSVGRILVTSFDNKTMPFIRYEIGDNGRFLPGYCACGIQTKKIVFEGRSCDFIYLPDGRKFPVIQLLYIVNLPGKIKSYQFIQKSPKSLKIKIVPDRGYNKKTAEYIKKEILKKTKSNKNFTISIELTDKIPLLSNGKSKILISSIKNSL